MSRKQFSKFSMFACCSPRYNSEICPFQKSDAGIYHVFSQYFSNCHIFKISYMRAVDQKHNYQLEWPYSFDHF